MSFNRYDLGDLVTVRGVFTHPTTGNTFDPSVVKLSVRTPGGVVTTYVYGDGDTIVKDSTGRYHAKVDGIAAGHWHYRWWSTGDGQAAEEKHFEIRAAKAV